MSIARRVRAGIALHAGVNVVFAAVAVISAAGGSAVAVASEGSTTADTTVRAGLELRHLPSHNDAHPLLGDLTAAPPVDEPTPTTAPVTTPTLQPARVAPAAATTTTPTTEAPEAPAGRVREVVSTGYCLSGTTASGRQVGHGMAAMNGVPLGTEWLVHEGPRAGTVFEVTDRIGHGTQFDIWFADCDDAVAYGRRVITIEQVS